MQITIDLPDEIAQRLTQTISDLPRHTLEALVVQAYRDELLTHAEVGHILNLSRWSVDTFLHRAKAYLHYDEADLEQDRATLAQFRLEQSQS